MLQVFGAGSWAHGRDICHYAGPVWRMAVWLAGWSWGGTGELPLNLVLIWVVMPGDLQAWAAQTGIIASSAAVLTGSIIGKITDSRVQLAQELKTLRRIQESQILLTKQEEILAEIERIIHVAPEIEQVFEPLASQAGPLIPYDYLSITSTDLEAGTARRLYVTGTVIPGRECGETAPLSNTLSGEIALTGATYTLDADSESEIPSRFPDLADGYQMGLRSFLAAPLISSDRVIGAIQFQACHTHAYQESHIEMAKDVAYQISGAIANAQLDWERIQAEQSLKKSEERYRCLAEISRMASSSPNLSEAVDNLISAIAKLVPFDSLSISRVNLESDWSNTIYETWMDSASDARKSHRFSKIPLSGTMTQEAAATRLPIRYDAISETEVASRYPRIHRLYQRGMRHFLAAPLISADAVVGVLHFASRGNNAYTEDHLSLSQDIAAQIAGSIANSQLYTDRLRTEEELNRSQERYRRMVENSPDAIVVTKMDEIIYVNPSGTKLLGAVEDQNVIGKHYLDFVHADFAAVTTERMGMAQEEMEPIPLRHGKIVGLDGQVRDAEVSGTPLVQGGERTLQLTLRDITDRLQAEQDLVESEARSAALLEYASEGIVVANEAGEIVLANARTEAMFDYTRAELLGNSVDILLPENLRAFHGHHRVGFNQNPSNRTMGQGLPLSGRRKGGSLFPVDVSLSHINTHDGMLTLAFVSDVTKSREAEEAIRESEAKYRSLLVQSPDFVFVSRVDDFKFTDVNDRACVAYGYSLEEFLNLTIFDIEVAPALEEEVRALYDNIPAGQVIEIFGVNKRKNGSTFPVQVRFTKLNDELALANVRDITELRQAEEEQTRLVEENLIMAELGRIISSSSDFSDVFELLGVEIAKLVPFDRMALIMVEANGDSAAPTWVQGTDVPGRFPDDPVPMAGTTVEDIIRRKTTAILEAPTENHLKDTFPGLLPSWLAGLRSFMGKPLSLDLEYEPGDGGDATTLMDFLGFVDPEIENLAAVLDLTESVERLNPQEKKVLCLRYLNGLSQTDAAARMGVSQMQVSRLQRSTLAKLRDALQGQDPLVC